MHGDGSGGFGPAGAYGDLAHNSERLVLSDLNGDGRLDLAILNWLSNEWSVRLMMNVATPSQPISYELSGTPTNLVAADFDGDGISDVAYTYWKDQNGPGSKRHFGFRIGQAGDSSTQSGPDLPSPDVFHLSVGDFNGDGRPDLAYTDAGGFVGVLLNTWKPDIIL
jgi:hypothetical protein